MKVTTRVEGLLEVKARLAGNEERARGWVELLSGQLHEFLLARSREAFASAGASEGAAWAPLEPAYARYKKARGGGAEILRWYGARERLYPSLTIAAHPDHLFRVSAEGLVFGSRVPHAARLETGGIGPLGEPYPARDVLHLGERSRAHLAQLVGAYVASGATPLDWSR